MDMVASQAFKLGIAAVPGFGQGETEAPDRSAPPKRFGTDDVQRPGIAADGARPTVIGKRRRSECDDRDAKDSRWRNMTKYPWAIILGDRSGV